MNEMIYRLIPLVVFLVTWVTLMVITAKRKGMFKKPHHNDIANFIIPIFLGAFAGAALYILIH